MEVELKQEKWAQYVERKCEQGGRNSLKISEHV